MSFTCAHCNESFTTKHSVKRHLLRRHTGQNHQNVTPRTSRILCAFSSCDSNFNTTSIYHDHLKNVHDVNVVKEALEFPDFQEFQNWKTNFEKETTSMFVQTTSAKRRNKHVTYYFYCHRSFLGKTNKRKGKTTYKGKHVGSNKMPKSCPAMIKAISTNANGTIKVEFCSTHVGHETSVRRLRLSVEDKNLIAEKLSSGLPPRCILADLRQNAASENDRIIYTEPHDLYNIKKAYGIQSSVIYDQIETITVDMELPVEETQTLPEEVDHPMIFYEEHNQDSDCENFEESEVQSEKSENSRLLAKFISVFNDFEKATLTSEQKAKISRHLDGISATISSVSKKKIGPRFSQRGNKSSS